MPHLSSSPHTPARQAVFNATTHTYLNTQYLLWFGWMGFSFFGVVLSVCAEWMAAVRAGIIIFFLSCFSHFHAQGILNFSSDSTPETLVSSRYSCRSCFILSFCKPDNTAWKKNHVLDQLRIVLKSYKANELFCLKLRAWINILNHLFHNLDLRAQLFVQICITLLLIVTSNSS